jgi:histidinol-phosphate aminotransferase
LYGSSITHAIGLKIARSRSDIARRVERCRTERDRVQAALARIPGVEAFPSVTNFILLRVADRDAAGAHARFLEHGVLVRDISMWPGCEGCLRVSIGTPPENGRFIEALAAVFEKARA